MTAPFVFADDQPRTIVQPMSKAPKDIASPPSGSSSDTLHENDTFDDERKLANVSPFSTATLNY